MRNLALYERFGEPIAPPIGMRTAFVQAFDRGRWVGALSPKSEARREIEQLVSFVLSAAAEMPARLGEDEDEPAVGAPAGGEVVAYRSAGLGDHAAAGLSAPRTENSRSDHDEPHADGGTAGR
jgi:hypothetical protein